MNTSVLALDLATTTGWAWHAIGMPRPFFDAFRLPADPEDIGKPLSVLEKWLFAHIEMTITGGNPLTHIIFERQHIDAKINMKTAYRLIGLGALCEKVAYDCLERYGIQVYCYDAPIQTWRKHFLGRGSGFKRGPDKRYLPGENPKELAIQKCAHYGWHTDIADAAEACGILDWFIATCLRDSETLAEQHPRPWRDAALLKGKDI